MALRWFIEKVSHPFPSCPLQAMGDAKEDTNKGPTEDPGVAVAEAEGVDAKAWVLLICLI